jgi:phytoene dehydrogenase-like protein
MKISLIAPLVAVSFLLAACGHKSARIASSNPSPSPTEAEDIQNDSMVSSSVTVESFQEQAVASPSPSASPAELVFKTQAATQTAKQYLDRYRAVLEDLNAKPVSPTSPEVGMNEAINSVRKLAQDNANLESQQRQLKSQLTPDKQKRLRQYQKSLEQTYKQDSD